MSAEKLYKLTDKNNLTRKDVSWGNGKTNKAAPGRPELCTHRVIHAYFDPLVARLMAPANVAYWNEARLWEAEGEVEVSDAIKCGCKSLTTVRPIENVPSISAINRVAFACFCVLDLSNDPETHALAFEWLKGRRRAPSSVIPRSTPGDAYFKITLFEFAVETHSLTYQNSAFFAASTVASAHILKYRENSHYVNRWAQKAMYVE